MKRYALVGVLILFGVCTARSEGEFGTEDMYGKHSFGVGFGIQYGGIGANVDVNIARNLNATAGLGTTVFAGAGYSLGLKYFLTPLNRTFRPRIAAYYGVNGIIVKQHIFIDKDDEGESYTGLSLGIGAQWMWGETKANGLDFDIMYLATIGWDLDELRDEGLRIDEPGKVKVSLGYRHAF